MTKHRDMKALTGAGRLVKAVETFLLLRRTIFPVIHGDVECAALWELELALEEAGGRLMSWKKRVCGLMKRGMKIDREDPGPSTIGRYPKKSRAK